MVSPLIIASISKREYEKYISGSSLEYAAAGYDLRLRVILLSLECPFVMAVFQDILFPFVGGVAEVTLASPPETTLVS